MLQNLMTIIIIIIIFKNSKKDLLDNWFDADALSKAEESKFEGN